MTQYDQNSKRGLGVISQVEFDVCFKRFSKGLPPFVRQLDQDTMDDSAFAIPIYLHFNLIFILLFTENFVEVTVAKYWQF